jgi:diguanylate cyclase (GGDEF)-like protein
MVDGAAIDWRLRARDGEYRRAEVVVADLSDDPNVGGIVLTMRDVTERRELESRLTHQAFHDPLTGLANRALFEDRVAQSLARFVRRPTITVAVAFIDLDDFKSVNDTLGHQAGDELLVEVSRRIQACIRPTDTAARLGGDEFAIALEIDDFAADEAIGIVVERLLAALQRPLTVAGREVFTRGSIGIAATPEAGTTVAEILRNADIAMYTAKRNGKGAMHRFTPDSDAPLRRELSLTGDLLRAVEHGEFHLEYQPIIDLASSRVRGLEALVRWDHPTHGRVRPDEFIRLAEESGAISDVGRWILSEACREFQVWRRTSPETAGWFVTVNISGHQLHRGDLVGDVRGAITATGIAPGNLVLELTESVLMDNTEGAIAVLGAIRALGVRVAIDDFGTGFSSLAYLKRLPIDVLKLAAPFVHGLADDDEPLTEAIVHLSRTLGLDVIAEGIERRVEADALRAMGCAMGQGFLFSRPMPAAQVRAAVVSLSGSRGQATAPTTA